MEMTLLIPIYNEADILHHTIQTIKKSLDCWIEDYEIILIDDGSEDTSWKIIEDLAVNPKVRGIKFSRNFGKEAAISAGLEHAQGQCIVVMDADLQHPPTIIEEMFKIWKTDHIPIVEAKKKSRGDEKSTYKLCSKLFYQTIQKLGGIELENSSDFKLIDRKVVELLKRMPERQTFFRGMATWTGLESRVVYFDVEPRYGGETKWSTLGLIKYATNSISSYTSVPLKLVSYIGIIFIVFSILLTIQTLVDYIRGHALRGIPTVILTMIFIGGVIMTSLGIIGHYIAKIYEEIKFRPKFVIAESTFCDYKESEYRIKNGR